MLSSASSILVNSQRTHQGRTAYLVCIYPISIFRHLQNKICFSGLGLLSFEANVWSTSLLQIDFWLLFLAALRCWLPSYFVFWLCANTCVHFLEIEFSYYILAVQEYQFDDSAVFTASGHCGCPEAQHWNYCMSHFCDKCSLICSPSQKSESMYWFEPKKAANFKSGSWNSIHIPVAMCQICSTHANLYMKLAVQWTVSWTHSLIGLPLPSTQLLTFLIVQSTDLLVPQP